jgi:periplasmic divalent cation tolerance protein
MTNGRIVLTTVGVQETAEKLAEQLVERRLAACVNIIGPIRSVYHWKGTVEREQEYLLLIKTNEQRAEQLSSVLKGLHPYELPELLEVTISGGSKEYLAWLAEN